MDDGKSPEVTFRYYLPDNQDELFLHIHASKMYCLLHEIDQQCRTLIKYRGDASKDAVDLAEELRAMIHDGINLDMIK